MIRTPYGTVEFYSELFSDILADVDVASTPEASDNIIKGFYHALESWLDYHQTQGQEYSLMLFKVREALKDD